MYGCKSICQSRREDIMNPELYLHTKRLWRKKRDAEAKAWREARAAITQGERPLIAPGAAYSTWSMAGCGICALLLLLIFSCRAQPAGAKSLDTIRTQLNGINATISVRDYPGFSDNEIMAINKAREELK